MKKYKIDFIELPEKLSDKDLIMIKGGAEPCTCDRWINSYCNCKGSSESYSACPSQCKK